MGRAQRHSDDEFVDAAAALFAAGGQRALTMSAVSKHLGASNGSIYHRFPERTALLAALWLRTTRRFQHGYFAALGDPPTVEGVVAAGTWITGWCRAHVADAVVLQAGVEAFEPGEWPESARRDRDEMDAAANRRLADAVTVVTEHTRLPDDQVRFAMFDLPLAVVRRYLLAGEPPPKSAVRLTTALVERVLTP